MGAADELVSAVAAPAHLAVKLDRGVGHHAVFRIASARRSRVEPGVCDWTCRISRPVFFSISAMVLRGSIADGISFWLMRSSETTCAALANAVSTAAASP